MTDMFCSVQEKLRVSNVTDKLFSPYLKGKSRIEKNGELYTGNKYSKFRIEVQKFTKIMSYTAACSII